MSTISEAIIAWLAGYSGITSTEQVDTDQVGDESVSLGLLKAPGMTETPFVDGSRDVVSYYIFRTRRAAQQDDMRVDNQEWLEGLEQWVRAQNVARSLPALSGGRECFTVRVDEASYLLEATAAEIVYQLGIEISYFEPKTLTTEEDIYGESNP